MERSLNILIVEDNPADFLLVERALRQQGLTFSSRRADSMAGLEQALEAGGWDLVLTDYSFPDLDFLESFGQIRSRAAGLPVILVSGSVGEERAVELLKLGVSDFVLKDNLTRLLPVVQRCLRECEEHQARVAAEASLRESEYRFRSIFKNWPIAIAIGRADDGQLIEVNAAWLQLFGARRDQVLGSMTAELDQYVSSEERGELVRIIREEGRVVNREIRLRRLNGEPIVGLYSAELITIGGEVLLQAMINDITEQKRLEEQLRQAQKMEAVGQLAGGVAHDFNNIMQIIVGNAQLQEMFNHDHGLESGCLEEIYKAVERGSSLTRSLLVFSRKQALEISCFDLNFVMQESRLLAGRLMTEEIRLSMELYDGKLQVVGDAGLMQRVLFNLITNARDAITGTGSITVTTELVEIDACFLKANPMTAPPGRYAMLAVSDTGGGIGEEIRSKIFEPFFTTKGVGTGTGLGLAMMHSTVEQMGGHITVDSLVGEGSVLSIYLPLGEEGAPPAAAATSGRQLKLHGSQELILITEDEQGVRDSLARSLQHFDYRVVKAACAGEAIYLVRKHAGELRLAIMDIVLPDKNGIEALAELRSLCPGLPALFLSGYSDEILVAKGIKEQHLRKPVHPVQLLKQVRRQLDAAPAAGR